MITHKNVNEFFTWQPPSGTQPQRYEMIREAARRLALEILEHTQVCADQQAALRKLRECVMTANAAIALEHLDDDA